MSLYYDTSLYFQTSFNTPPLSIIPTNDTYKKALPAVYKGSAFYVYTASDTVISILQWYNSNWVDRIAFRNSPWSFMEFEMKMLSSGAPCITHNSDLLAFAH